MSWRIVVVSKRSKLDLKMGYMVIRNDQTQRVFLDEIATLIIENPAVAITGNLLEALVERKIKVILCNKERNPLAELVPYYGSFDSSKKIANQIQWSEHQKTVVWTDIVSEKIRNQAYILRRFKKNSFEKLIGYADEIELGDVTNREGHAAKVYFNSLFGMDFSRESVCPLNAALNYGYSIILSLFNRTVVANGYITQLGLHHSNQFNKFNLSSDLMEPYRILVDKVVFEMNPNSFSSDEKYTLVNILNETVEISNSRQTVINAVNIYCKSVFEALESGDTSSIRHYRMYEL